MDKKEVRFFIGQKIKTARELNNITVDELAGKLNTSASMIWKWSTGHTGVSIYKLFEIADALGVTLAYLVSNINVKYSIEKNEIFNIIDLLDSTKLLPQWLLVNT